MVTVLLCKFYKGVRLCGFYHLISARAFSLSRENKNISDQTHAATGLPRRRKTARTQCLLLNRQTSFYWFHLIALQSFFFKQIEGSWQLCMEQVRWCHFCNSICSLHVSVSHFGNSPSISDLVIIVFVAGIHDQ